MEKVEGKTDLSRVETSMLLGQTSLPLHVEHQVTSIDKLNDKEKSKGKKI